MTPPRFRLHPCLALPLLGLPLLAFGCNGILGIDDHSLAPEGGTGDGTASVSPSDDVVSDSTVEGTNPLDASVGQANVDSGSPDATLGQDTGSTDGPDSARDSGVDAGPTDANATNRDTGVASDAMCTEGTRACNGQQPTVCQSGTWANAGSACANTACVGGNCVGNCAPTATRCSDGGLETCAKDGTWPAPSSCASMGCGAGSDASCPGVCEPGNTRCTTMPQSCAGSGLTATGPGLNNCASGESCCLSPEVQGGTYYRTYGNDGGGITDEMDPATVSSVLLDKYEVTVGRFRKFVTAWDAGWRPPKGSGKHAYLNNGSGVVDNTAGNGHEAGWLTTDNANVAPTNANLACDVTYATWTSTPSRDTMPINCINWWEAYAFCIWDGGFLPTEAEWEYAAAGGSGQREYPWGDADPGVASQYAIYGCYYPDGPNDAGKCLTEIAPVGAAAQGLSLWGQQDLAGNLNEWILDYDGQYQDPCTDCASVAAGTSPNRVIRGGDFIDPSSLLVPSNRNTARSPATRTDYLGFRCARSPSL